MKHIITLTLNPSIDTIQSVGEFVPFEKNLVSDAEKFLGGKGINVSFCLGKLGADCTALGFMTMADQPAYERKLDAVGVGSSFITVSGSTRENLKIVDLKTGKDTEFNQPGFQVSPHDLELLDLMVEKYLADSRWMILSGSLPPGVQEDFYRHMISLAKLKSVKTCLDTSGNALCQGSSAKPDVLRINLGELQDLSNHPIDNKEQMIEELGRLNIEGNVYLVISLGSRGVIGFDGKEMLEITVPVGSPVSLTGAGDAMTAAFVHQLDQGKSFREALAFSASIASASVLCTEPGDFRLEDASRLRGEIKIETLN